MVRYDKPFLIRPKTLDLILRLGLWRAQRIMRGIPKTNCLVGGSKAFGAAVCFAGAACFHAKSSRSGLMALYIVLTMSQVSVGVILFKKSKNA